MRKRGSGGTTARRGFTLPELLVSITITAMVMVSVFGTLYYTVAARDTVHNLTEAYNAGPAILDRIAHDLRQIWVYDLAGSRNFLGRDLTVAGAQADALDFVASVPSSELVLGERRIRSRLCEIGYHLRANPKNPDFLELWRREDFFVDEEPFEGGAYELVYDRVKYFNVTYFDRLGTDAEPIEEWATEAAGTFPRRIQIDLAVETQPRVDRGEFTGTGFDAPRVMEFTRTLLPPVDWNRMLAARLRPKIPVPSNPAGQSLTTAAGSPGAPGMGGRGGGNRGGFTAGGRFPGPTPAAGSPGGSHGGTTGGTIPFPPLGGGAPPPGGGFPIPH
ncbi:MAG TPA: prepilin-type N-terminal cleavage/methylation domain-containing protein [Planctomycetota bacterium]|jgi:prepilin-type N-terminal cleavage/methylation domain-containing protein|nr:prepilin-type N-terminal cleavage/methylation domain-containing protein [Planctomycetota bacterium]